MEQYDVRWFEEPVVPEDLEVVTIFYLLSFIFINRSIYASTHQGYRRVQAKTSIPIAGGECSFMRWRLHDHRCDNDGHGGAGGDDDEDCGGGATCMIAMIVMLYASFHCQNFKVWFPGPDSKSRGTLCFHCSGI